MHALYNLSIYLLVAAIRLGALFNSKAKKWVDGRRNWRAGYPEILKRKDSQKTLWVHVSSLGEFEQGRPVIEAFRAAYPGWRIVLSFFSPSGYEIRKDYALADAVLYLPADSPANARDFLDMLQPDAAVFIKYDFWANYLFELKKRNIPTLLVSALFRPSQAFFKWYGVLWRKMLNCFSHIFVQNEASLSLLREIGVENVSVAGDTRVDRVLRIASEVTSNAPVEAFVQNSPVIVIGSSWEADEQILIPVLQRPEFQHYKIIIAPHEPSVGNVQRLCAQFKSAVPYSSYLNYPDVNARVMVIDNIGLLNILYKYGTIAYIGGGFGKGIHNTLEPAAFGLPIIFGPKFEKFEEARQFVARAGAFPVHHSEQLTNVLQQLQIPEFYEAASKAVLLYLEENKGASEVAIAWFRENIR